MPRSRLQGLFLALIAHQLVIYPHGRIRSRVEWTLVRAAYALAVGGYAVSELFNDPRSHGCTDCSRNLLLVYGNRTLNSIANDVAKRVGCKPTVVILTVLIVRWRAAGQPGRRALAPITWAAPAAVAIAVLGFVRDSGVTVGTILDQLENNGAILDAAIPIAFLIGLLRLRLRRAGVTDLVVELSNQPSPNRIRAALAKTLGDPSLEVALWLPDQQHYVDLDGALAKVQAGDGRAVSIIEHESQPIAALVYDQSLLEDPSLGRGRRSSSSAESRERTPAGRAARTTGRGARVARAHPRRRRR
jgi:hypothetical protein